MSGPDGYAPVFVLPLCSWCRHLWAAHRAGAGCRVPVGRGRVCGCREPPPGHPPDPDPAGDGPDHDNHDQDQEERAA
ncbi:hypothetical protein [Protofrankia sp. BMG5.30]|uniref:hypothetical protein n=1 Tax=Protofrankia sp. BMG5.30 TaxID=1834514 RepID=UPI000976F823|nr:hypothetical protein [Protofrankia sp. BMG5.30]ONH32703.1 hypothetical protein BL254_21230 [Protofrankia sp. BMG5.30]